MPLVTGVFRKRKRIVGFKKKKRIVGDARNCGSFKNVKTFRETS